MRLSHALAHIEQQFLTSDLITKAYNGFVGDGLSTVSAQRISVRLSTLKEEWEGFCLEHKAILIAINELNDNDRVNIRGHLYFSTNLYTRTHAAYIDTVERLNSLLDSDQGSVPSTSSTQLTTVASPGIPAFFHHSRLPRIDLPKFNGTPSDWIPFKDLFQSLVIAHPTLSSVEKLQYLKTSLTGSAASLLQNTMLSAENFQKSWDALNSFYENKRLLVHAALHSLFSIKRMMRESAVELEKVYTQVMQIYRSLESLQRPVSTWDDFLIFIIVQRIDPESVKAWEQHLGSSKEPPTWRQFNEFLITRLLSLQAFENSRAGKHSLQQNKGLIKSHYQGKSVENKTNAVFTCSICSANHYTANCSQYKSKSVLQRLALISKHKLCYNCLGLHRIAACRVTRRCQKCGKRHHTSIHKELDKVVSSNRDNEKVPSDSKSSIPSTTTEVQTFHSS